MTTTSEIIDSIINQAVEIRQLAYRFEGYQANLEAVYKTELMEVDMQLSDILDASKEDVSLGD